jgi:heme/copper-type cytochrome/quinol oxidase subunit 1
MVIAIVGLLASAVGTTILVALLGRALDSGVELDALWAKNLTYFFGHSVANLTIYLAAGAVYVLLPGFTGRPWKTTKPIAYAWLFTLVFVVTAYSHHLYMDFVQPGWAQGVSSIASFGAALPPAVVTIFTGMLLVWGSRYRWTLASALLYLGFAGWAIGGTGAVIDSLIPVNFRFHNTAWVPAHFHTYLLLCVIFWALALFAYLLEDAAGRPAGKRISIVAVGAMLLGGYGFVAAWYASGALGVPRRWAVHPPGTSGYSLVGSIFVVVFAVGFLLLLVELARLAREARGRRPSAAVAPEEPLPEAVERRPLLTSGFQYAAVAAAVVGFLAAFFPQVTDAVESSVRWHHLQHAAEFLFGALLGVLAASLPSWFTRIRNHPDLGIAAVILAPAAMLLAMVPGVYDSLESDAGLHFLYHLGIAGLGFVTGLGAGALGLVTGWLVLVLAVGMGAMFAAGVTGG